MLERTMRNIRASAGTRGLNRLLNLVETATRRERCRSFPTSYWIEVTNRCNLNCRMCRRRFAAHLESDMDSTLLEKTEPLLRYAVRAELNCWGESLMAPGILERIYDHLSRMPVWMVFTTNGMLLTEKWLKRFIGADMELVFSFDGARPETFEAIRTGADFQRCFHNIKRLAALRAEAGRKYPLLSLRFVAMTDNVGELAELVPVAEELGVENIYVVYLVAHSEEMKDKSLFYHAEMAREAFAQARESARSARVNLWLPQMIGARAESAPPAWSKCVEPWRSFIIKSNGDVNPCCHTPKIIMGNLKEREFEDIWNGEAYRLLRKSLRDGHPPAPCLHCHMSHPDVNDEFSHVKIVRAREGRFCGYEFEP